ncbi:MAG TPA: DUF885 family protein, partial [Kofleriaceae bacterium]|nr:DUF885 family protein [Kofleriaceae bacterium]
MAVPLPRVSLIGPALAAAALACSSTPRPLAQPAAPPAGTAEPAAPAAAPAETPDRAFEAFAQRFLDDNFRHLPHAATGVGEHRYDATWPDVSAAGDARYHKFLDDALAALARFPRDRLSEQNRVDAAIIDD